MNKTMKTNLLLLFVGLLAAVVGIFFTVAGKRQLARDTEPATAVVIEYTEAEEYNSASENYNTVYYPVVSYEANGTEIRSQYT